jgi:hypothetical protein
MIPEAFETSFLHCLMGFMLLSANDREHSRVHFHRCKKFLIQGRLDLLQSLGGGQLSQTEAVSPIVVVAKLCQRILQDLSPPDQPDIEAVYWEYYTTLVCSRRNYKEIHD